ncbi:hypothetical protein ACS0TY_011753 [Phlomoides rotata]
MASEGLDDEEWDDELLDKLVQAEEKFLSTQKTHLPTPTLSPSRPPPRLAVSYSPPRELSQRTRETRETSCITDSFPPPRTRIAKEPEVDVLKKELNRVSQRLNHLEEECSVLRRERDEKEQQLKVLHPEVEKKDAGFHLARNNERNGLVSCASAPGVSTMCENANTSNKQLGSSTKSFSARGMQTDKTTEVCTLQNACCRIEKLYGLWNSNDQKQGRVLVSNLFKTCEADFHVLSGYLNPPENDSSVALSHPRCPAQLIETAKIVHLYSLFTKISNNALRLEDLLEALVDVCNLKNVVIVHWSLRVLHKILSHFFSMETDYGKRENVTVEDIFSANTKFDTNGRGQTANEKSCYQSVAEILKQGQGPCVLNFSNLKNPGMSGLLDFSFGSSVSGVYLVSLFERMCLIATRNNEEQIRVEALSIMNLILVRHNAYLDRIKFIGELTFRSLSQLLRKEAGFSVQDQAVHALYLLCNCPKVVAMISSRLQGDEELAYCKGINDKSFPTSQCLNEILIRLADCVACYGSATPEEMKLRRNAIVFLAFLGSSGKSSFEILINHRLPKGTNFLAIILQSLISDLDLPELKSAKGSDIAQEQSLLIREALILLNRLVSHPQYSVPVLKALIATRDMASMTVDIANRLTQKRKFLWQDNKFRESEIVDLVLVFKKRVFTFLEDNIS